LQIIRADQTPQPCDLRKAVKSAPRLWCGARYITCNCF